MHMYKELKKKSQEYVQNVSTNVKHVI